MRAAARRSLLLASLALAGCIDSGNKGWDFGGEPDPAGGPVMEQAWRGVHEGRVGFRCRNGQILFFVETWHPLPVPAGERRPMTLSYSFEVGSGERQSIQGVATTRGIEIPAATSGEGAPNSLLRGLDDDADELLVILDGAKHLISILFDVDDAGHAHRHVQGGCGSQSDAAGLPDHLGNRSGDPSNRRDRSQRI